MLLKDFREVAGCEAALFAERLAAGEDSAAGSRHRRACRCGAHGVGDEINCAADDKGDQRQNEAPHAYGSAQEAPRAQSPPPGAPQSRPRAGPQQSVKRPLSLAPRLRRVESTYQSGDALSVSSAPGARLPP